MRKKEEAIVIKTLMKKFNCKEYPVVPENEWSIYDAEFPKFYLEVKARETDYDYWWVDEDKIKNLLKLNKPSVLAIIFKDTIYLYKITKESVKDNTIVYGVQRPKSYHSKETKDTNQMEFTKGKALVLKRYREA
jgi:hypothetical protein